MGGGPDLEPVDGSVKEQIRDMHNLHAKYYIKPKNKNSLKCSLIHLFPTAR